MTCSSTPNLGLPNPHDTVPRYHPKSSLLTLRTTIANKKLGDFAFIAQALSPALSRIARRNIASIPKVSDLRLSPQGRPVLGISK